MFDFLNTAPKNNHSVSFNVHHIYLWNKYRRLLYDQILVEYTEDFMGGIEDKVFDTIQLWTIPIDAMYTSLNGYP